MQSSPSTQGYALPSNVDPPDTVCFTVRVPNDAAYIKAFIGALYDTTLWVSWQRDTAHTGTLAAQRMKKVWLETVNNPNDCDNCPVPLPGGLLEDFEMPLRIDCDCNVFITCCDGTEKQILTADQVKALMEQQPGAGAQQPPAGGCVTYSGTLQSNGRFLLPTVVNTGDTITVLSARGLTNDDVEVVWRNYAGDEVLAGVNIGAPFFQASDLLPTAYHDSLLLRIGTSLYPAYTPFTVPSGVSNAQPVLLLNVTSAPDMAGSIDLQVEVCNNQQATWSHTFDFISGSQGWTLSAIPPTQSGASGAYVPGVGWTAAYTQYMTSVGYRILNILSPVVTATQITGMEIFYTGGFGNLTGPAQIDSMYTVVGGSATSQASSPAGSIPAAPWGATWAAASADQVQFVIFVGVENCNCDPGGHLEVSRLIVSGIGTDPF